MINSANHNYNTYVKLMHKIADLRNANAVLQWDQEVYLPENGAVLRGQQLSTLSELSHEIFTDETTNDLLKKLLNDTTLTEDELRNVRLTKYEYDKNKKLPSTFVRKSSEVINESFHAWVKAKHSNDFNSFEKPLQAVIDIKKQEAEYLGYEGHSYNALLNDYEKGATVNWVDDIFEGFKEPLKNLIDEVVKMPEVDDSFLKGFAAKDKQWNFTMDLLKKMGFNFKSGRQDISEHPFSTSFNSKDVRITTRIDENDFSNATWSTLHELGHAFYELGLPIEQYGLPLGEYCSLSIHESQSRFWENCIGRSKPFCSWLLPLLNNHFDNRFMTITDNQLFKAVNKVQPSLIRTEADELTYHFHVMIRYELEKELISGNLQAKDIPAVWNELYLKYLGVKVPDYKSGCLQDVHWSHGSFGYFATYSLGTLWSVQLYNACKKDISEIDNMVINGRFSEILSWLNSKIHVFGKKFDSIELGKSASGPLSTNAFMEYAKIKYLQAT